MKKKQVIILCCCTALSFIVIVGLYALSPLNGKIYRGGFDRSFDEVLVKKNVLDIEFNSFYIAGVTKDHIYLGNTTAPLRLLKVNTSLSGSQHIRLKVELDSIREPRRFRLLIDSPNFFLMHGTEPQILRGVMGEWVARPIMHDSGYYFVEAIPMSHSTFALRSYNIFEKGYELAKKNADSLHFNNNLLVKQIDGVFCVDGRLHYSKTLNRLVYLHFYRNEFTVIDTALALQYRGHTIDTFSHAMIRVSQLKEGTQSMISSPPMLINGLSCVYKNNLYVQSAILAKNEDPEDFVTGSVIDVYDLITRRYFKSFHIPNHEGQPMTSFQVSESGVFVLVGNYIIHYELQK